MEEGGYNMEDDKIIKLFFERDENAIKEIKEKYGKLCYSIAFNVLENDEDVEECLNDTFLAIWNTIPPTNPNNLKSFVCKVVRNQALKRVEYDSAKKRYGIVESIEELDEIMSDDDVSENVSKDDLSKLISDFLKNESEENRKVFIRKYFFFDSIEDISKRYSFSNSKIKNMLYRTRNKLKQYLIEEGVSK